MSISLLVNHQKAYGKNIISEAGMSAGSLWSIYLRLFYILTVTTIGLLRSESTLFHKATAELVTIQWHDFLVHLVDLFKRHAFRLNKIFRTGRT